MCKGLLLCGRLDLADGRNDDLRNLVNIEFGRIDGEVIIREIVPALIRVEVVVIRTLLIAFCDKIGDLLLIAQTFAQNALDARVLVGVDEYAEHVVVLAQDVVAAASDDDARAFIRSRLDDVALKNEQLIVDGHIVDAGDTASEGVVSHHHGIQKAVARFFVRLFKDFLAQPALFCRHGNQLLVEKGDIQFFRQALADLVAAASVLTRNGNNR